MKKPITTTTENPAYASSRGMFIALGIFVAVLVILSFCHF